MSEDGVLMPREWVTQVAEYGDWLEKLLSEPELGLTMSQSGSIAMIAGYLQSATARLSEPPEAPTNQIGINNVKEGS